MDILNFQTSLENSGGGDGSVDGFVAILIAQSLALCNTRDISMAERFREVGASSGSKGLKKSSCIEVYFFGIVRKTLICQVGRTV